MRKFGRTCDRRHFFMLGFPLFLRQLGFIHERVKTMVRSALRLLSILTLLFATSVTAWAEKRVALLIGNSNYAKNIQLKNPANDASRLAEKLKEIGFDKVTMKLDLAQAELRRTLGQFSRDAAGADIALIYFAGHGIEVGGTNYVIPTDANLSHVDDVEFEAIELSKLMSSLSRAGKLKLVILDACRINPFKTNMISTGSTRAVGRGLARVNPAGSDTLVAYAAREGTVADDGSGDNSPYAEALIKHIATPGLDVRLLFGRVRDEVLKSTGRRQEPFTYGSLGGDSIYLKAPQTGQIATTAPVSEEQAKPGTPKVETSVEGIFWNSVKDSGDPAMLADYLSRYPAGTFSGLAKLRLKALNTKLALAAPTNPLAIDVYPPVPVVVADPVEIPRQLTKLLTSLAQAADNEDLATIRSHVGKSFFWDSDHGGGFDAKLPPADNFTNALNLDLTKVKPEYMPAQWQALKALLQADTASRHKNSSNTVCLPGKAKLSNKAAAEKIAQKFDADPWFGMMYSLGAPTIVRSAPERSANIVGTVVDEAVFVRHELRTNPDAQWEPVRLATGVVGWARKARLRVFLDNQLCFANDAGESWKIVGYNAGGD